VYCTWESLSKECRSVWDMLSDGDKKKILQYVVDRAEKPVIQANQHETSTPDGPLPLTTPPLMFLPLPKSTTWLPTLVRKFTLVMLDV
jgi:hypothetical protein